MRRENFIFVKCFRTIGKYLANSGHSIIKSSFHANVCMYKIERETGRVRRVYSVLPIWTLVVKILRQTSPNDDGTCHDKEQATE